MPLACSSVTGKPGRCATSSASQTCPYWPSPLLSRREQSKKSWPACKNRSGIHMTYLLPLLLGLAHGVSDASAGLLVGIAWQLSSPGGKYLILLYNGLASGLQPLAGLLLDRLNQPRRGAAIGLLCTAAGLAVTWWT